MATLEDLLSPAFALPAKAAAAVPKKKKKKTQTPREKTTNGVLSLTKHGNEQKAALVENSAEQTVRAIRDTKPSSAPRNKKKKERRTLERQRCDDDWLDFLYDLLSDVDDMEEAYDMVSLMKEASDSLGNATDEEIYRLNKKVSISHLVRQGKSFTYAPSVPQFEVVEDPIFDNEGKKTGKVKTTIPAFDVSLPALVNANGVSQLIDLFSFDKSLGRFDASNPLIIPIGELGFQRAVFEKIASNPKRVAFSAKDMTQLVVCRLSVGKLDLSGIESWFMPIPFVVREKPLHHMSDQLMPPNSAPDATWLQTEKTTIMRLLKTFFPDTLERQFGDDGKRVPSRKHLNGVEWNVNTPTKSSDRRNMLVSQIEGWIQAIKQAANGETLDLIKEKEKMLHEMLKKEELFKKTTLAQESAIDGKKARKQKKNKNGETGARQQQQVVVIEDEEKAAPSSSSSDDDSDNDEEHHRENVVEAELFLQCDKDWTKYWAYKRMLHAQRRYTYEQKIDVKALLQSNDPHSPFAIQVYIDDKELEPIVHIPTAGSNGSELRKDASLRDIFTSLCTALRDNPAEAAHLCSSENVFSNDHLRMLVVSDLSNQLERWLFVNPVLEMLRALLHYVPIPLANWLQKSPKDRKLWIPMPRAKSAHFYPEGRFQNATAALAARSIEQRCVKAVERIKKELRAELEQQKEAVKQVQVELKEASKVASVEKEPEEADKSKRRKNKKGTKKQAKQRRSDRDDPYLKHLRQKVADAKAKMKDQSKALSEVLDEDAVLDLHEFSRMTTEEAKEISDATGKSVESVKQRFQSYIGLGWLDYLDVLTDLSRLLRHHETVMQLGNSKNHTLHVAMVPFCEIPKSITHPVAFKFNIKARVDHAH